jgi:hypothetical protein
MLHLEPQCLLVVERARFGGAGVSNLDRILASVSFFFFYPLSLIVAGLDLGRYGWSPGLPIWGQLLASIALPISLGSTWALLPAFIGAASFIMRTKLEDDVLQARLDRYPEYAVCVRYRLIPGVW